MITFIIKRDNYCMVTVCNQKTIATTVLKEENSAALIFAMPSS